MRCCDLQVFEISLNPAVPEPGTVFLIGAGLFGLAILRKKRR
jgi:hypothetical protein